MAIFMGTLVIMGSNLEFSIMIAEFMGISLSITHNQLMILNYELMGTLVIMDI